MGLDQRIIVRTSFSKALCDNNPSLFFDESLREKVFITWRSEYDIHSYFKIDDKLLRIGEMRVLLSRKQLIDIALLLSKLNDNPISFRRMVDLLENYDEYDILYEADW